MIIVAIVTSAVKPQSVTASLFGTESATAVLRTRSVDLRRASSIDRHPERR
jgi:hypothetical protein